MIVSLSSRQLGLGYLLPGGRVPRLNHPPVTASFRRRVAVTASKAVSASLLGRGVAGKHRAAAADVDGLFAVVDAEFVD